MGGHDKFKEVGEKLKADQAEKEEKQLQAKEQVLNQLAELRNNPELAKMYQDSSKMGAENLGGESPLLKVHATGRSTKNELADGSEPKDGNFFYKPTGEEFDSIDCHILTISKGFKAEGLQQQDGSKKEVFNQILGGVIINDGELRPFIIYFTGLKLSYLWEFGKAAAKYTRAKPVSIPMFALTVRLTTEKKANNYGKSWIVKFEILKNEDGTPQLVMDPGEFQYLKDNVETTQELIASVVASKAAKDDEDNEAHVTSLKGDVVDADPGEEVNLDDVPF